jgi:hypothetical protein
MPPKYHNEEASPSVGTLLRDDDPTNIAGASGTELDNVDTACDGLAAIITTVPVARNATRAAVNWN